MDMLLSGSGLQLGKGNNYRDAAWLGECDKVGVDIIFIFFILGREWPRWPSGLGGSQTLRISSREDKKKAGKAAPSEEGLGLLTLTRIIQCTYNEVTLLMNH